MGIIKINARRKEEDRESTHVKDSDVDFDISDVDCETIKVKDQTCSIPYDIYNLDDLREVLSLETWNSCLSEEERYSLTAYLPSVDQGSFELTMRELLNGENLFFGSPLDSFFLALKGGLYSPRVVNYREALRFIHVRNHYHSLRSYQDRMCQTLENMKKCWRDIPTGTSVDERLKIWMKQKKPNYACPVDLNIMPAAADDDVSMAVDRGISLLVSSKEKVKGHSRSSSSNTKPKGVLKIRSKLRIPEPDLIMTKLPSDGLSTKAHGVLKIKPMKNHRLKSDLRERDRLVSPVKNHRMSDFYHQRAPLTLGLHLASSFDAKTDGSVNKNFGQQEFIEAENGKKMPPMTHKRKTRVGEEKNLTEERKPVKVKLKIWTSPDTRQSSGLLNSL